MTRSTVTTRHYVAGVLAVLATFGGIALYNHAGAQARAQECVAQGFDPDQCWGDRR